MKQKDAVLAAITQVVGNIEGVNVNDTITPEQRKQVHMILVEGFNAGTIDLKVAKDEKELNSYTSGLINNWLRKGKELNGGVKYMPKNPGSRAGSGDEQLKAIRLVKSTISSDDPRYADVVAAEATRMSELAAAKVTTKPINIEVLPAALQAMFKA